MAAGSIRFLPQRFSSGRLSDRMTMTESGFGLDAFVSGRRRLSIPLSSEISIS
jgi:hypothetical protein